MKYFNAKQDMKEVKIYFRLIKNGAECFIKKHSLFNQTIKTILIILKWLIFILLINYSFGYFSYLNKKSIITEHQKLIISQEQTLNSCMSVNSMNQFCEMNIVNKSYPLSDEILYSPFGDNEAIAKESNKEFDKYINQAKIIENGLSDKIIICLKKASVLNQEKGLKEKQETIADLNLALNSYINLQKQKERQNNYGRPDNYYNLVFAEEEYSRIRETENKCTINELKNRLYYYQGELKSLNK